MNKKKPELLAPAGDMERLIMAVTYGADSVYLAGTEFGMRAASNNFNLEQMKEAVEFAHSHGVKVYVTVNTLPREDELDRLKEYLAAVNAIGPDAFIICDLGVMELAKEYAPDVKLHISTQLGVINSETAKFLYNYGAETVVLARETPMEDIRKIHSKIPEELNIEAFVHGAMCVSFSGRCLLSNYLTGRDANRGACAQPCRWKYRVIEEKRPGEMFDVTEETNGTYILNSRDMCMIEHIPELIDAGVQCFKIEGRMKSAYYAAVVTNAYRHAIDAAMEGKPLDPAWVLETEKVSHRPYSTGFYYGYPGQNYSENGYITECDVVAVVEECDEEGHALLTQRNKFFSGDDVELLVPGELPVAMKGVTFTDLEGNPLEDTRHAMMQFKMDLPKQAPKYSIIRKNR